MVNVAFTAINSHVILPIARECAAREGDFWVVYMGNNEMVGPYGAATVFGRQAPPLPYVRLVTALQATRTGQLCVSLARRLRHTAPPASSWAGMEMFLQNQIAPDNTRKENVYRNFEKNLDDILQVGTSGGAKIILNTVAVNTRDCPPFASIPELATETSAPLPATDAEKLYRALLAQHPDSANVLFRLGQRLHAQGKFADAREFLQRAVNADALPFRTDARENGIIRELAAKYAGRGVRLWKADEALASNADQLCGDETFYEHVHFNFSGSYRLGRAWAEQIAAQLPAEVTRREGWLEETECAAQLGLSAWNQAAVWEHMAGRLQVPPFAQQPGNAERIGALRSGAAKLKQGFNPQTQFAAQTNYLAQLAARPEDFELRQNYALFLRAIGDFAGSEREWRRVAELIPQDFLPYYHVGVTLSQQQQWAAAETEFLKALAIRPALTDGWIELGKTRAARRDFDGALSAYGVAARQRPRDAQVAFRIGEVYALQGNRAGAMEQYRESIRRQPANWEAHFELGGLLDAAGQLDAALEAFGAAAQLRPDYSRARYNFGVLLAKHGRFDEAKREFEETLRLEPGYRGAQENLAKIMRLQLQKGN